jgi:ferritin-like metal-binding protein YciE
MADEPTARDAKLIQYLNEAYGKEKELETALKAHISMTTRDTYKKRLREHLKETSAQAKGLERRIKQLGGKAEAVDIPGPEIAGEAATAVMSAAKKGASLAKGPLHMIRGTGEAEKQLKNAKTELWNEMEEIGNYLAIEELAKALGDRDTEKLAKEFRRQEERMASFLQKLIPQLTKQVVKEEIPASERRANGGARRRSTTSSRSRSSSTSSRSSSSRSSGSSGSSRSSGTTRSSSSRSSGSGSSRSSGSSGSRSSGSTRASSSRSSGSSGSRSSGARSSSSRSSSSRSSGSGSGSGSRSGSRSRSSSSGSSSRRSSS